MKKIIFILLGIYILFFYTGCNKDNPVESGNSGTTTTVTNTFVKTTPPVQINTGLNQDIINVDSSGNITSMTFALDEILGITATQLEIFLVHNGITDTLVYQLTNAGNNFIGTIFSDAAQNSINTGSGDYTGTFKPYRPLSIFNGQNINGQWTLIINSFVSNRTGVIKSWGITVSYNRIQIPTSQWVQMSNGMGNNLTVNSFTTLGNNIFVGISGYGVYFSTDNGTTWTQTGLNGEIILSYITSGNNIFAGTWNNGVYLTTNNGSSWTQTALNYNHAWSLTISGINIFAGTNLNGVYLSTDNGSSWTQTALNNRTVRSLVLLGNYIFAGTDGYGVYSSINNGTSWTQTTLNNRVILSFVTLGNNIFAGTDSGVYLSTDIGISWAQTTLNNRSVGSLAVSGTKIFAGIDNNYGVYLSTDNGSNWTQINQGFSIIPSVWALLITNNYIFAGTQNQSIWRRGL